MNTFETRREVITRLLRETGRPLTVYEIMATLGIRVPPEEIYLDLQHIAKSIRAKSNGSEVLLMEPPRCKKCGYVFSDMEKPKEPSRCPRCKSEWIEPPRFIITSKP
ncbi:MAG: transcriptional regulator [Desulfurococcus sp.]|nr:transcriptional regulator [Desulfurococcus sp.]